MPLTFSVPVKIQDAVSVPPFAGRCEDPGGGQTLLPTLKMRLAQPSALVDLSRVRGIRGHYPGWADPARGGHDLRHVHVASSSVVRAHFPALAELAGMIGDPAVRNRGTIGGSLANNDPSADYPAAVLALAPPSSPTAAHRRAGLFSGPVRDRPCGRRMYVAVEFPQPDSAAYRKFGTRPRAMPWRACSSRVSQARWRVAVTGVGQEGVFRWQDAEAARCPPTFRPLPWKGSRSTPETWP